VANNVKISTPSSASDILLKDEQEVIERIFNHIDNGTTDLGDTVWQEPVEHYRSQQRFADEIALLRRIPVPFCPSAALPKSGSYLARKAAGTPLLIVRDAAGVVHAFINACRHRGMQVATGSGCGSAFSCPYHGWTYNLDGKIKGIPGRAGFPDLDPEEHGLVEVSAFEKGGIVYVAQVGSISPEFKNSCFDYFAPEQEMFEEDGFIDQANWKLLNETAQEGYHIKSLHRNSFYPYGLDNTNLVDTYGANSRIIFPFRRIEKLRDIEPHERRIDGAVTTVYHLFPNVSVSVLSKHTNLVILEPLAPGLTQWVIYRMINRHTDEHPITLEEAVRDARFVNDSGQDEDREAACAIQETVTTSANTHLTFGHYEKAIVNFHQHLAKNLDK
jgi:phenylpropionate dioxygenase-like ring-hydroxylating dioxygenase large terminal subunit